MLAENRSVFPGEAVLGTEIAVVAGALTAAVGSHGAVEEVVGEMDGQGTVVVVVAVADAPAAAVVVVSAEQVAPWAGLGSRVVAVVVVVVVVAAVEQGGPSRVEKSLA